MEQQGRGHSLPSVGHSLRKPQPDYKGCHGPPQPAQEQRTLSAADSLVQGLSALLS